MIKVNCATHTEFAARHLVNQLGKLGHQAQLVDSLNLVDRSLHIIYNAHALKYLPPNYIIMNTEVGQSHWFTGEYLKRIANARAVWDYSEKNQRCYYHSKKCIVTPGVNPQQVGEKDIPLLFYGWIDGSERRKSILDDLQTKHDIFIVTDTLGQSMWDLLSRTKVVLNVHYYDNSPPELYRICEAISFGCSVWMHDENEEISTMHDNLEELKQALNISL